MEWIEFFLQGMAEEGRDGVHRAERLLQLRDEYRRRAEAAKVSSGVLTVVDSLFSTPIIAIPRLASRLNLSYNAVQTAIKKLENLKVVSEISGRQRNRLYIAAEILEIIQA